MAISVQKMVRLQRKLNAIFVHKRDAGEPTSGIYGHLVRVESWLSERGICW